MDLLPGCRAVGNSSSCAHHDSFAHHDSSIPWRQWLACTACMLAICTPCYGANRQFLDLSIEELGNIKVTSVSKKQERLTHAAASIYVITADHIRRSGARNIPEALRLAPHLQVAQINANQYAISARGFNSSTANKLLVLMDGRTIYTPLYSGVFWDANDTLLLDIERIEVISGPGGSLWGANAVNGIINIITKSPSATQGELMYASAGNVERSVAVRHGGALTTEQGHYRVYAKFSEWNCSQRSADGAAVTDGWQRGQGGFRSDWASQDSQFTLQGDIYRTWIEHYLPEQQASRGANLLGRWNKQLADGSELKIQSYVDHTKRHVVDVYREQLDVFDVELQYSLPKEQDRQLIWGGGYRVADDQTTSRAALAFVPSQKQLDWINLFVEQKRRIWPDWHLTLGGKLEHNNYTGVEFLPTLKLAWQASDEQLVWAQYARTVRAPSRVDTELYVPAEPPHVIAGGANFRSEIADTLELGWRTRPAHNLSWSLVAFHSQYTHLRSFDLQPDGSHTLGNQLEGTSAGLEALVHYQVTEMWALEASGLLLDQHFQGSNLVLSAPGNDPDWQWGLSSKWNLNDDQYLDVSWRRVGELPEPYIPAYTQLNIHYGWSMAKQVEWTLTGRNLLERFHQEFAENSPTVNRPIHVERALDLAVTVRF